MKVLVYDNVEKDAGGVCLQKLTRLLTENNIEYFVLHDDDLSKDFSADAIFTIGGDGTILWLVEFANRTQIPIIGINMGKLGFLSEFELHDIEDAVILLKNGELKTDKRDTLKISINGKVSRSLNDAYIQRVYQKEVGCMTTDILVHVDGILAEKFKGDGAIICTATGSTAYSLSAGGPILAPMVNAFSISPIAAHALNKRPIVCSSDSIFEFEIIGKTHCGLFVDGRHIAELKNGDKVVVEKAEKQTVFLRRTSFNFYKRLTEKLKDNR